MQDSIELFKLLDSIFISLIGYPGSSFISVPISLVNAKLKFNGSVVAVVIVSDFCCLSVIISRLFSSNNETTIWEVSYVVLSSTWNDKVYEDSSLVLNFSKVKEHLKIISFEVSSQSIAISSCPFSSSCLSCPSCFFNVIESNDFVDTSINKSCSVLLSSLRLT